ncbi:hypothetical protein [Pseudoalteromonas sp. SK18]|uniref:hypothetical protein n=1 Tax=Pseudoalteromonas sp. SK18 TaxID=1938366 RepID=UPI0009773DA3|nr:hypothetical protein [Pseudoalteromonas sp. SK18]
MLQLLQESAEKYPLIIQPLSSFLAIFFAFLIAFYVQYRMDKRQRNNHEYERGEKLRAVEREKIEVIFKSVETYINDSRSLMSLLNSNVDIKHSNEKTDNDIKTILIRNAISLNSSNNNVSEAAIISKLNFNELAQVSDNFIEADSKFYTFLENLVQFQKQEWKAELRKCSGIVNLATH